MINRHSLLFTAIKRDLKQSIYENNYNMYKDWFGYDRLWSFDDKSDLNVIFLQIARKLDRKYKKRFWRHSQLIKEQILNKLNKKPPE